MLTVEKMYLKWGFVLVFKFGQCTGTYAQGSLLFEDVLGVLGVKVGTKVVVDGWSEEVDYLWKLFGNVLELKSCGGIRAV